MIYGSIRVNTGQYENKICKIGTYASILGALLFLYRGLGYETSKNIQNG